MPDFKPWEYVGKNTVRVVGGPTKNPKKMTGTRLGAILGVNKWKSPFGAWCEIMRVAEEPFEGNKYTEAGNVLEPKILEWCKGEVTPYIVTPAEWFKSSGKLYDHFPKEPVFGGQWDALALDKPKGKPIGVIEAKTSSRPQDWETGVPASYAVQALAYAHLLGVDRVFVPVRFMEPDEYEHPELCECNDDNTFIYELRVSEYPGDIVSRMADAEEWWHTHVEGNISPAFDEKQDKVYLDIMRRNEITSDDLETLAKAASVLEAKIEVARSKAGIDELEKQLEGLKKQIKPAIIERFTPNDEVVVAYGWRVKKSTRTSVDTKALERDALLEKYTVTKDTFTLTKENTDA